MHRYVAEDQDLALKVEVGPPDAIPEPQYRLGVFHSRSKNVLLCSVVQHQLQGESSRLSAVPLSPGRLDVGDLPNYDLLFGACFRFHR